jgi:molybdopterin-binding protein
MPKKAQGWITFQSSAEERQILEQICQQTQRTKTDVLREMLRKMRQSDELIAAEPEAQPDLEEEDNELIMAKGTAMLQSVNISARNIFKAKVKQVVKGTVNAEITLIIAPDIELVSMITRGSAEKLKLRKGKIVFAVIKSNSVMLAEA